MTQIITFLESGNCIHERDLALEDPIVVEKQSIEENTVEDQS